MADIKKVPLSYFNSNRLNELKLEWIISKSSTAHIEFGEEVYLYHLEKYSLDTTLDLIVLLSISF